MHTAGYMHVYGQYVAWICACICKNKEQETVERLVNRKLNHTSVRACV